jgi:nucleotide-binding universal stress UspA family protein
MTKKILFPTDFSHTGDAALELAESLARDSGAELLIVHVEEEPMSYAGDMYYGEEEPASDALEAMLKKIVPKDSNVPYKHISLTGDPASGIVTLARDEGVDSIVLGSQGRSALSKAILGSVAEQVIQAASCAVITYSKPSNE